MPTANRATFRPGHTYENVYLVVVDAAGYSTFVRFNPRDQAARAFDLLRERIIARLDTAAAEHRCARTELWSWQGDGGIFTVHDDDESAARDVALTTVGDVLRLDVPQVRAELTRIGMLGQLRLRLAVHKGTIRFSADGRTGAVHSPEVNFAAHLEEATPPDCIAISEDVYETAGPHGSAFTPVGLFEDRPIYLATPTGSAHDARRAWLSSTGLTGSRPVFTYPQRPSQAEKARLIAAARHDIIDLGTALHTSAHYLTTTERPAHYRDAVLHFLAHGGTYRAILLDPTCEATGTLSSYRQENLADKIRTAIVEFGRFKDRHGARANGLQVYQSRAFPGFAAIAVDLESPDVLILYSPYLMAMKSLNVHIERGDTPHYLATNASGPLMTGLVTLMRVTTSTEALERVL